MKRASISRHVEDLEGKINQLLEALSTTQMITKHCKLSRENTISQHVEGLEGKINQLLEALFTTQMITDHFKLNQENNDMERASISHHVEDFETIKRTEKDCLKERTEERMKTSNVDIGRYRPLIKAMQENNVKDQKDFIDKDPGAVKAEIDEFGNTVFHLFIQQSFNSETVKLLKVLVSKVLMVDSPETLEKENVNGLTALDTAASAGNTEAVKVFVKTFKRLFSKEEEKLDMIPVLLSAASWGRKETVRYLLPMTDLTDDSESGAWLLKKLIESNLYGIALGVLKHYPKLALREGNNRWNEIVQMLSEKYLAFASGIRLGFWENLIYHYIPLKDDEDRVAWPIGDSEDDDEEKQNPKCSTNCSEEFPTLPQIASTIDALKKSLYIVLWPLWNALYLVLYCSTKHQRHT
ncbi:hypothetical protein Dsin_023924 [Dipteronia sinensis]|uniref:Uncharacterized protein n=1 Tax=Dipteronia sinensis TaxID=43782 RepID=A0AAE0A4I1_9ROSI|nr:hypothetical protein Dsin_023924 [Dipteronia sinensis]